MLADRVRMDPYAVALKSVVKPDSVVLDIGTGIGIHALLACKFGARRVYAVETNEVVHLAQRLAAANGFADRVVFMQADSTQVDLPESADIIVSDLRGTLPLFGNHIATIQDARKRHLAPGGVLIPQRDTLWAAVVQAPRVYTTVLAPWDDEPYGFNFRPARSEAVQQWRFDGTDRIDSADLLTIPIQWAQLPYQTIESPHVASGELSATVARSGTAHGVLVWFDAQLVEGVGYSHAPGLPVSQVYGRGFFPFPRPAPLTMEDEVTLAISARLTDDRYEWRWRTRIMQQGCVSAEFDQTGMR